MTGGGGVSCSFDNRRNALLIITRSFRKGRWYLSLFSDHASATSIVLVWCSETVELTFPLVRVRVMCGFQTFHKVFLS